MVDQAGLGVRRGLAVQPDPARALGVEHDQPDRQPLVLVGGVAPRVVELVEDVRSDPARPPLAVPGLGPAGQPRRSRRTGGSRPARRRTGSAARAGRPRATAGPRRARRTRGERLDDRAADLAADLLAAVGDLERDRQDRLGRARARPAGTSRPNRLGNIRRHAAGSVRSPFITARARTRSGRSASASSAAGAGHERVGLDRRVDDRPTVAGRVLEAHPGPLSPARRGRAGRPGGTSTASRSPGAGRRSPRSRRSPRRSPSIDRRIGRLVAAAVGDLGQPGRPGLVEIVDVGPLVLDLLAEVGQGAVGDEARSTRSRIRGRVGRHGRSLAGGRPGQPVSDEASPGRRQARRRRCRRRRGRGRWCSSRARRQRSSQARL